jgi:hypothetical protein
MITSIRSPSQNARRFCRRRSDERASARTNSLLIRQPVDSILAFLAPSRFAQTRRHASPCAIAPTLVARSHSRGTLAPFTSHGHELCNPSVARSRRLDQRRRGSACAEYCRSRGYPYLQE